MESTALDYLTKLPRVKWSSDMRIFLCCMIKYFEKESNQDFQAIFNARFRSELEECGFGVGRVVKWPTLNTQWEDMRRNGDPIWGDVHLSSFDHQPWSPVLQDVEQTAVAINLRLARKVVDSIDSSPARFTYRSPEATPQSSLTEISSNPVSESHHSDPATPATPYTRTTGSTRASEDLSPEEPPLCMSGGKICFWCYSEELEKKAADGLEQAEIPTLLYRWWNVESHTINSGNKFVAGWFADISNQYFAPDTISEDEFHQILDNHVDLYTTTPSPFISTFESLLAPIHRGLRKQEGASISIIDSKKLRLNVYSAKALVKKFGIKKGRRYNGQGEYLVWGQIDSDAIICTFKCTKLRQIVAEHPDVSRFLQLDRIAASKKNQRPLHQEMAKSAVYLDKSAGFTVGKLLCLLEVPFEHSKDVSERFAYSWRVKTRRIPWRDYFDGVEQGYKGLSLLPSPEPESSPVPVPVPDVDSDMDDISDSDSDTPSEEEEENEDKRKDGAGGEEEEREEVEEQQEERFQQGSMSDDINALSDMDDVTSWDGFQTEDGTPTPISRTGTVINNPFKGLDSPMETQQTELETFISLIESSDEEIENVQQQPEQTEWVLVPEEMAGEEATGDLFATDRARVQSAIGNLVFNPSG